MRLRIAIAVVLLACCAAAGPAAAGEGGKVTAYMYSEYIDPEIPAMFRKATGYQLVIDTYEAQEEMLAKLKAGAAAQYDVVIATDVMVPALVKLGLVRELDQARIPNARNVDQRFRDPPCDKGNRHCWPYQWGTIGLIWRTDKVQGEPSWSWVLDPAKQPGPVVLMDEMRSMLGVALRHLGRPMNTTKPEDLKAAGELLLAAARSPKCVGYDGGTGARNRVIAGEAIAAVVYNGDAVRAMSEAKNLAFAVPKEGSNIWVDMMLVLAKAPNPDGAHAFVNYILDAQVGARLSDFNRFATPNAASLPLVKESDRTDAAIYPSEAVMQRLEYLEDVGAATRLYDEVWTRAKAR